MHVELSDGVIDAVARLFGDGGRRVPSHSDLQFHIQRAGLAYFDPYPHQSVGKAKRVRHVLSASLEADPVAGARLVGALLDVLRAAGGFRTESENYVGNEAIANLRDVLKSQGLTLTERGEVVTPVLENLPEAQMTEALAGYARRALQGSRDAALVVGTGKDLVEATARHVLLAVFGSYREVDNFEAVLGQAFAAVDLATPAHRIVKGEPPRV